MLRRGLLSCAAEDVFSTIHTACEEQLPAMHEVKKVACSVSVGGPARVGRQGLAGGLGCTVSLVPGAGDWLQ